MEKHVEEWGWRTAPLPFLLCSCSLDDFIQAYNLNYYFWALDSQISFSRPDLFLSFRYILLCFLGIPTGIANSIWSKSKSTLSLANLFCSSCISYFSKWNSLLPSYPNRNSDVCLNFFFLTTTMQSVSKTSRFYLLEMFLTYQYCYSSVIMITTTTSIYHFLTCQALV